MSADTKQTAIVNTYKADMAFTTEFRVQLQGTLTFTQGSAVVSGTGTAFRPSLEQEGQIKKGDYLRAATSVKWYRVLSVPSPTSLILNEVFAEVTETGVVGYVLHIGKGIARNFDFLNDIKGIYVFHLAESTEQVELRNIAHHVTYGFLVVAFFYEPDEEQAETRKAQYNRILKAVIEKDLKAGNSSVMLPVAYKTDIGPTKFYFHPTIEGGVYLTFSVTTLCKEAVGV